MDRKYIIIIKWIKDYLKIAEYSSFLLFRLGSYDVAFAGFFWLKQWNIFSC